MFFITQLHFSWGEPSIFDVKPEKEKAYPIQGNTDPETAAIDKNAYTDDIHHQEELSWTIGPILEGRFQKQGSFIILDISTGKKSDLILHVKRPYMWHDYTIILLSYWKYSGTELLVDSRALVKILKDDHTMFYGWIFSKHRAVFHSKFDQYFLYLK